MSAVLTRMPTVRTARAICKQGNLAGVIVIGLDNEGRVAGASYGATMAQCRNLAPWLDHIMDGAGRDVPLSEFGPVPPPSDKGGT